MICANRRVPQILLGLGVGLVSLMLLGLSGCLPVRETLSPTGGEVLLFYVENRTERAVHLQVLADQRHLFSEDLEAPSGIAPSGEGRELPLRDGYRGKEVKVIVERFPKELEVREVLREVRARFPLTGLQPPSGFGYRIVVSAQGIELFADYVPIR